MYVEKDFGDLSFLRLTGGKQKLLAKLTKLLPPTLLATRCPWPNVTVLVHVTD